MDKRAEKLETVNFFTDFATSKSVNIIVEEIKPGPSCYSRYEMNRRAEVDSTGPPLKAEVKKQYFDLLFFFFGKSLFFSLHSYIFCYYYFFKPSLFFFLLLALFFLLFVLLSLFSFFAAHFFIFFKPLFLKSLMSLLRVKTLHLETIHAILIIIWSWIKKD